MVPLGRPGQRDDGDGEGPRGQLQGSQGCFGGSPLGPGRSRVPRNLPRTKAQTKQARPAPHRCPLSRGAARAGPPAIPSCLPALPPDMSGGGVTRCCYSALLFSLKCASTKSFLPQLAGLDHHINSFDRKYQNITMNECMLTKFQSQHLLQW